MHVTMATIDCCTTNDTCIYLFRLLMPGEKLAIRTCQITRTLDNCYKLLLTMHRLDRQIEEWMDGGQMNKWMVGQIDP